MVFADGSGEGWLVLGLFGRGVCIAGKNERLGISWDDLHSLYFFDDKVLFLSS